MKKLLNFLVTEITGKKPIKIETQITGGITILTVTVPKENIAQLIGRGGRIINSIRQIVGILAVKQNTRVNIEIQEPLLK